ncbi:50S ribosomal protein L24 [Limibacillus sp. MBR-115]|jgi:large subunit ribosomal protein L24|uniref:50S ribosomal protein L24 n=1 Tax=Limibacillus sp. MBR-115 TaxID=3156465 RepID=UPI00339ADFDE
MAVKMKVKKGDRVIVLTGRDKGKEGEILRVMPAESRVLVAGVNMVRRHQRATPTSQGGIEEKEAPIHVSNVAHIDPREKKPTRVGFKVVEGRKIRVARLSGEAID